MNKRVLGILFVTLFIVMLGFSVLFPVEAYYIERFGASSRAMGVLISLYSLGQFIFSPLWGRLSDRIGRKRVIMIGIAGYAVAMALFGASTQLWELFVARALAGVLSSATLPTAMAVIADSTDESTRARGMGFLGAAFGLGVIFGPALGGFLGNRNLSLPYYVTAGLAVLNLIYVIFTLPETLPPAKRGKRAEQRQSRWAAFDRSIAMLFILSFVVAFALAGLETSFGFLAAKRLNIGPGQLAWLFTVMGLVGAIVQGGLIGPLQKRLGEVRLIPTGLFVAGIGYVIIAAAASPVMAALGLAVFAGGNGLIRPSNASLITRRAKVGHGLAIGLLDSFDSMGRVTGPTVAGLLFALRDYLPFATGAVLTLGMCLLFTAFFREPKPESPPETT